METTKLYYEDAYLREFDAAVLSGREEQGRYLVVLDRTDFYPEGGGQPADHGVLGGVAVTDVQERDGVVCHTCAGPLAVGSTVHGAIDWQRRFDHMQQHSGEHIVSCYAPPSTATTGASTWGPMSGPSTITPTSAGSRCWRWSGRPTDTSGRITPAG